MIPRRPLSEFVNPPEVNSGELQVEWHQVRRRVRRHRQVRLAGVAAASLLFVGLIAGVVFRPNEVTLLAGQQALALDTGRTLTLIEGSEIQLTAGAQLDLTQADENEVVVVLQRGRASFDVARRPSRSFVVKADSIEVRVVGTKFAVRREGRAVEVEVERGIVLVREGDVVKRLVKGERWARVLPQAEATAPIEPDDEMVEGEEEAEQPQATRSTKRKVVRPSRKQPEPLAAAPTAPVAEEEPITSAVETPAAPEPSPADAFAAAMRARAGGHTKEAIVGFQQVCERWPSSAFAPMSAFEWGRLALDSQDDPRQAVRAFERTLELATSASLVEDALARLTEAYARYDAVSCRRAQSEYLRRFPGGPHVRGVTKACPP